MHLLGSCGKPGLMGLRVKYSKGCVIKVPLAPQGFSKSSVSPTQIKHNSDGFVSQHSLKCSGKAKKNAVMLYLSSYLIKKRANSTSKREVIPCSAQDFSVQSYFENGQ